MSNFLDIEISEPALDIMTADAIKSFPNECCGFFYGKEDGTKRHITTSMVVDNSKEGDQKRRFEIKPLDYMKAERYALENNLTLLGVYHSHPNHPAKPSIHDLKQAVPYFSYIIVSVSETGIDDITSWQLGELGEFKQENIVKQYF